MTPNLPDSPTHKIVTLPEAIAFVEGCRAEGKAVVFANGCFDILHAGHVSYLNASRAEGDALIVAINSDVSECAIKGPGRPIMPQDERAELIAGMEAVDRVVVFDDPTVEDLLRQIRPDVHAKGTDYTAETVPERRVAHELGIRIAITGAPKTNASKQIMREIAERAQPAK